MWSYTLYIYDGEWCVQDQTSLSRTSYITKAMLCLLQQQQQQQQQQEEEEEELNTGWMSYINFLVYNSI